MKNNFSISLKNRLALTYAILISFSLGILILIINHFTGVMFNSLIKENIAARNREIVRLIEEHYRHDNHGRRRSDVSAIDAMGMYFVQQGHIISINDERGNLIWDARSQNRQQCDSMMRGMANRMGGRTGSRFNVSGETQLGSYPVNFGNRSTGTVNIETYGPFFYSETESRFLSSLNRLLFMAWLVLTLISIIISVFLSRTIAKPIHKAGEAAKQIAHNYSSKAGFSAGMNNERPVIRIDDSYHTRELAELSKSINSLAEEIEGGELRQRQLVSDIAHELRTPLSCLRGTIEAMIDGVYAADREHLESCNEEIIRLSGLVEDLNTLTSFEWNAIELNKTEFDLSKMLFTTAEHFMPAAMEKGIKIILNLQEAAVTADYERLKQVFMNLLSNAVKYTDQGSITITVEGASSGWLISIADTGIGIPESELPRVFERFYRSDKSRSRSTGGAGIGLSIAAAIIAAHNGAISAKSIPTGGTVFCIQLRH